MRDELTFTGRQQLLVDKNEKKGGQYWIYNKKTNTIRTFANSDLCLTFDSKDGAIIKAYEDKDQNEVEYVKSTGQLRNSANKDQCLEVVKNDDEGAMKVGKCNSNNAAQKFYPFYTYQVPGN